MLHQHRAILVGEELGHMMEIKINQLTKCRKVKSNERGMYFSIIFLILTVALSFFTSYASANNLEITSFEVSSANEASNSITFTCDVDWDNSWRNVTNYDAVWLFLKYSTDAGVTWHHSSMRGNGTNPDGFTVPVNFEVIVPLEETGMFLQRTDLSVGDVTAGSLEFIWDYGQDGLSDETAMASNTINKVFGIEMVYIPEGSFYAGDGASSSDFRFKEGSLDNDPWYIQNENAITTTNGSVDGYYYSNTGSSGEDSSGAVFLIPTSFPKGFQSFYQMKYELTESQWVGFFNSLTAAGKPNRDITSASEGGKNSDTVIKRNTVSWDSSTQQPYATTTRPERPVSYISWPDLLAYADWAGLRPMTELEFEKSARGEDIAHLPNEYVWGKTSYNAADAGEIFPNSDENGMEQIFDGAANINRNNLGWTSGDGRSGGGAQSQVGPLRAGIFAESSTNRATSGAGYYGTMELSGNLHEMVVTVGREDGRQFLGTHGDGELTDLTGYEGNATNNDWPGINSTDAARGITGTTGSGYRGGDFMSSDSRMFQLSTRSLAAKDPDSEGYNQRYDSSFGVFQGGRLGRTAP